RAWRSLRRLAGDASPAIVPGAMRAHWIEDGLALRTDVPDPVPSGREVIVRVRLSGVCNTDLELARGYLGYRGVPGHEFVGEVLAAPPESGLAAGRRVVGEINAGCGTCAWCRGDHPGAFRPGADPHAIGRSPEPGPGDTRHCPSRSVLGILGRSGAHAEFLSLPARNLTPVPDDLPDEAAVFVEPVAAACEILDQVPGLGPDVRALVLGDGKLGLLTGQVLAGAGCRVLIAGRHPEKLAIAAELGLPTAMADSLPPDRWDLVVEATGASSGLAQAVGLVRPRGTLILKSTVADPVTLDLAPIVIDEVRLFGSRCGRFAPAIDRLRDGTVQVAPLISARYPLSDGITAFHRAAERGVLKVLLSPDR
ncbi:MAG TPA: alcohol dehydrogenase catalytic domain-containing protein, partial [Dehalococcoidia bacterium]|nr:alcohol dehydrogenase catalytic domain-containing protein [Dehalococcoidia bacterium]